MAFHKKGGLKIEDMVKSRTRPVRAALRERWAW
jgi:hypothetical protein